MTTTPCVFCGNVPEKLPHMCLLEKRKAEEAEWLRQAFAQEKAEYERRAYHRDLTAHYNRLVEVENRVNERVSALEVVARGAAR